MRERSFVERRQPGWQRLEIVLQHADRVGIRRLPADELRELALLYRATTSDLAIAQARGYAAETRGYLNRLTARAHAYVYSGNAEGGRQRIAAFFTRDFPAEFRRSWIAIGSCAALFAVAAVASYVLVTARPLDAYALMPSIPLIQKSLHDSNFAFDKDFAPAMSSAIITNNIKVAAIAFAGGMTAGIVTIFEILSNGIDVGAMGALYTAKGFGYDFWATIAPHGAIELTAIQIAGGAGLLIASAIVAPGRMRRVDALKERARRAGTLILGVVSMLVVAGLIEGFFSPTKTAPEIRLAVGAATACAMILYFTFAGRRPDRSAPGKPASA